MTKEYGLLVNHYASAAGCPALSNGVGVTGVI
ncbi:MAG: hypothetical protein JWN71_4739 [Xanthobacteraceae bacterium]|jgi:hypothetical protein|nr:hypothetical protein [Xanthobacteraceae bacterium]